MSDRDIPKSWEDQIEKWESYTSGHVRPSVPPWDERRKTMKLKEVPLYIDACYGIRVSVQTIRNWIHKGVRARRDGPDSDRVYLKAGRFPGRQEYQIRKEDIDAFMEID